MIGFSYYLHATAAAGEHTGISSDEGVHSSDTKGSRPQGQQLHLREFQWPSGPPSTPARTPYTHGSALVEFNSTELSRTIISQSHSTLVLA